MFSRNLKAWGRALGDKEFRRILLVVGVMNFLMMILGSAFQEGWLKVLQVSVFLFSCFVLSRKLDEFY